MLIGFEHFSILITLYNGAKKDDANYENLVSFFTRRYVFW